MRRLDQIKETFESEDLSSTDVEWLIKRVTLLEDTIKLHLSHVPQVMAQKNNNSMHFILIDRLKKALEDET